GDVENDHHAEMDGIDTVAGGNRRQHRSQDDDAGQRLHEHADDQKQHVRQQQEHEGIGRDAADQRGQVLRDVVDRQQIGEQRGETYDQHDGAGQDGGFGEDAPKVVDPDFLVDEHADEQAVYHGDHGGLGGSENAGVNAAQDDDGHHQGKAGMQERSPYIDNPGFWGDGRDVIEVLELGDDGDGDDQRDAQHQAGEYAGKE